MVFYLQKTHRHDYMTNKILIGKSYWNKIASGYSKTGGAKWIRHPWAVKLAGNVKNKKVLELGCGSGVIINKLVEGGAIGTGADYSDKMLEIAGANAKKSKLNTKFLLLDVKDLSRLYRKKFDLIIISTVLTTFPSIDDLTKVLSEANKVLKSTGFMIIVEPHPAFDHYMRTSFINLTSLQGMNYQAKGKGYVFDMADGEGNQVESIIYHWRFEDYATAIYRSGLYIERMFEPSPLEIAKSEDPKWYKDRSRYASYIFFRLKRRQLID